MLVVPFLVGFAQAVTQPWQPASDWALMELRVLDVGGPDTPLVGPYSRYGWEHPGPLLYWLLAAPYRLLGSSPRGLLAGALLINASAIAGVVWFAWRRGGLVLVAWSAFVVAVLVRALGPTFLRDPWNPHVTVLPFACLVLAAWSMWCGDRVALPVGVGVACFLVQSHVGYAPEAAVLLLLGSGGAAWTRRRDLAAAGREWRGSVLVALVIGAAAWLAPVADQVGGTGNLADVVGFAGEPGGEPVGIGTGARLVATQLGSWAPWVSGTEPVHPLLGTPLAAERFAFPLAAPLLVAAAVWAARRGAHEAVRLCVVAGVVAVVGVVAVSRIVGFPYTYLVRWLWVVGAVSWLAIGWAVLAPGSAAGDRAARGLRRLPILAVALLVVATSAAIDSARSEPRGGRHTPAVAELLAAAQEHLGPPVAGTPVLVEVPVSASAQGVAAGLARHGYDVRFEPEVASRVGTHRRADARSVIVLRVADATVPTLDRDPRWRRLAVHDPRSRSERAVVDLLPEALRRDLSATAMWLRAFAARPAGDRLVEVGDPATRAALVDLRAALAAALGDAESRTFVEHVAGAAERPPMALYRLEAPGVAALGSPAPACDLPDTGSSVPLRSPACR